MADMGKKNKGQAKANLSQCDDPWFLPQYYFLRKNDDYSKSLKTDYGYWKETGEELTAIRSAGESSSSSSSSSSASPSYVGVRKTMEFYLRDGTNGGEGTKTDWVMHEYHHLRKDDDGEDLILQEDVVLRKVCKKNQASSDSLYRQIESCAKAYKEPKQVHCSRRDNNYGEKKEIILRTEEEAMLEADKSFEAMLEASRRQVAAMQSMLLRAGRSTETLECNNNKDKRRAADEPANRFSSCDLQNPQNIVSDVGSGVIRSRTLLESLVELQNEDPLGLLNEDLGADCDCGPDGNPDSVWEHFTKIRTANEDPDGVYAACHRCDKLLKVDPRKHDTCHHLRRHIDACSSCVKPNASTDEDREMLHRLRTVLDDPDEQQKVDCQEDLTQLGPWDPKLTPWFVARSSLNPNRQTQGGEWKEVENEFTAIRKDQQQMQGSWKDVDKEITEIQMDHQMQKQVPQYMGLRRTLQFHTQDGRKVDWIMLEYQQVDVNDIKSPPELVLQVHIVIRKVFRYDKEGVASAFSDLDGWLNEDDDQGEYFNGASSAFSDLDTWLNGDDDHEEYLNGEGVNTDTTTPSDYMDTACFVFPFDEGMNTDNTTPSSDYMDTPVDRKRKRTSAASGRKSKVWMHFTKIRSRGLLYVVCHICDRGYTSGSSKNGTSHLWRHNKSCTNKGPRTENMTDATTEWEAEIWPRFLLLKNYEETEHPSSGKC